MKLQVKSVALLMYIFKGTIYIYSGYMITGYPPLPVLACIGNANHVIKDQTSMGQLSVRGCQDAFEQRCRVIYLIINIHNI